jgi:hypothetical protein
MFNLASKYLYHSTVSKLPFNYDLIPEQERNVIISSFGNSGFGIVDTFLKTITNKIPPFFTKFLLMEWRGDYDAYLAEYKSDLSKQIFKRRQLEFKLIKYEEKELVKLNREQFGEEKRVRDIFNLAAPSFKIKISDQSVVNQIAKNTASLLTLSVENESPDLDKLMELRFVQQDIGIIKKYILDKDKFTDLSEINDCINGIGNAEVKEAVLHSAWCDPINPTTDTLCLNSVGKSRTTGYQERKIGGSNIDKNTHFIHNKTASNKNNKHHIYSLHNYTVKNK